MVRSAQILRCFINHFYCRIRGIVSLRYDRRNVCIPPRRWGDLCRRRTGIWHHLHSYRCRLRFLCRFRLGRLVTTSCSSCRHQCNQYNDQPGGMPRRVDQVDGVVVAVGVEVLRPGVRGGTGVGILRQEPGSGRVVVPARSCRAGRRRPPYGASVRCPRGPPWNITARSPAAPPRLGLCFSRNAAPLPQTMQSFRPQSRLLFARRKPAATRRHPASF